VIALDAFWRFVCFRPGLAAACREWEACLGPGGWQALKDSLFAGNGLAANCLHPDGRTGKVAALSGGRYALVCCDTGTVIENDLSEEGLRSYRLDPKRLRAEVARALDVLEDPQPVRDAFRLVPLGNWTPVRGHDVTVNMMLPPSSAALCRELQLLARPSNAGSLVLVPHPVAIDTALRADLKQQKVSIVPLCEVLELDEEVGLMATPAWATYRSAYCSQFLPELMVPAGPDYAFEWAGDFWHLTFAGKTTHVKDGIGARYLALLLSNPRKSLYCPDIIAIAQGNPILKISHAKDFVADDEALQQCQRRLTELEEELAEAKEWNDVGRQEMLQQKVDDLREHLTGIRGLHGRTRTFSGGAENARTSATNAINRLINSQAIQTRLPEAYRHLDKAISRGNFMSYDPETPVDWVLSVRKSEPLHAW
jgi:hypothetical protein